ncbi:MAG: DUF5605 domain-containing protein [Lachnospiraceae bacterium]|nr:DUF5605 domain-containing protein [Lachnospiraceae bacterium]
MRQYETMELSFQGTAPEGSQAVVDLTAEFVHGDKRVCVNGFYAGDNTYKIRFFADEPGEYHYTVRGLFSDSGSFLVDPVQVPVRKNADGLLLQLPSEHGIVHPDGCHLRFQDGTYFQAFGTTVYALMYQKDALINETMETLKHSPFNKIRLCVFPKHYRYNTNEPEHFPFCKRDDGSWDVDHPDFIFWDRFEKRLRELFAMGIQVDLILFHPYDRWGFSAMPQKDNLIYLDYLLRRFSAYPGLWWSMANEYDLCFSKTKEDWLAIEEKIASSDPWHHMLGNHNCFRYWDPSGENITHLSWQTRMVTRVGEMMRRFGKPVLIDECCYEGNLPESWGSLSGEEMVQRFWRVDTVGGYCTHGETYLPGTKEAAAATDTGEPEVVWWAKGGRLNGKSPARIAFLRSVLESLPPPLSPLPEGFAGTAGLSDEEIQALYRSGENAGEDAGGNAEDTAEETADAQLQRRRFAKAYLSMGQAERDLYLAAGFSFAGHAGEDAYLWYKDTQCCAQTQIRLPETHTYRIELLDTWEMTRTPVRTGAHGTCQVELPGKPYMAVLAVRENIKK